MTPSAELILSLARGDLRRLESTGAGNDHDWETVLATARQHGVDALCWWSLREAKEHGLSTALPDEAILESWRHGFLHHSMRNDWLKLNLVELTTELRAAGIEHLVLKGAWMAFCAYPDPGTRPIGDIDLCVDEGDFQKAVDVLREIGYTASRLPETAAEALRRAHYGEQIRFSASGRRPVELHFRVVNIGPPGAREDEVWKSTRTVEIGALRLNVPGPETMLLQLLLHVNQHAFAQLRLLHDIRWALQADSEALDWDSLRQRVTSLRAGASAYHALLLARDLAGADVPEKVLDEWRPSRLRRMIFSRIWRVGDARRLEAPRKRQETEAPLFYLFEMGRIRDKIRYVREVVREAGGWRRFLRAVRRSFRRVKRR